MFYINEFHMTLTDINPERKKWHGLFPPSSPFQPPPSTAHNNGEPTGSNRVEPVVLPYRHKVGGRQRGRHIPCAVSNRRIPYQHPTLTVIPLTAADLL